MKDSAELFQYSYENLTNILDHLKNEENIINQGYKNHHVVKYNLEILI